MGDTTMDEMYDDDSDHEGCEECGCCITCDDCNCGPKYVIESHSAAAVGPVTDDDEDDHYESRRP